MVHLWGSTIADAAFDLPFGPGATGTTGLGRQSSVPAEGLEAWIPDHLPGLKIVGSDQRRSVVAEDSLGETVEVPEGPVETLEPIVLALREEGPAIEPA